MQRLQPSALGRLWSWQQSGTAGRPPMHQRHQRQRQRCQNQQGVPQKPGMLSLPTHSSPVLPWARALRQQQQPQQQWQQQQLQGAVLPRLLQLHQNLWLLEGPVAERAASVSSHHPLWLPPAAQRPLPRPQLLQPPQKTALPGCCSWKMWSWTQPPQGCRCRRWPGSWRRALWCWRSCTPSSPARTSRWDAGASKVAGGGYIACRVVCAQVQVRPRAVWLLPISACLSIGRSAEPAGGSRLRGSFLLFSMSKRLSVAAGHLEEPAGGSRLHGPASEAHAARLPADGCHLSGACVCAAAPQVGGRGVGCFVVCRCWAVKWRMRRVQVRK